MRLHDETSAIIRKYRDDHAYWGASHPQHCTSEQALDDLDAILARHQAPTVSDGEREGTWRLESSDLDRRSRVFECGTPNFIAQLDQPVTDPGINALIDAHNASLAAGYRRRPMASQWGVEFTEPLNGDRHTYLFDSEDEAREFATEDTTSGNYSHVVIPPSQGLPTVGVEDAARDAWESRDDMMRGLWIVASRSPDGLVITEDELVNVPREFALRASNNPLNHTTLIEAIERSELWLS